MKKIILSTLMSLSFSVILAQGNFWGTTFGGNGDGGMIYRFSPTTPQGEVMHSFPLSDIDGSFPEGSMIIASDGMMYGVTNTGGKYGFGVLYKVNPNTNQFQKLYDFPINADDELLPQGSLVEGADGFLYGFLDNYPATLYKISKTGGSFAVVNPPSTDYKFENTLMKASDGNLYGVSTPLGGKKSFIYKLTTAGVFIKLVDLTGGSDYAYGLMQASNGRFYGMIPNGTFDIMYSVAQDGTDYKTLNLSNFLAREVEPIEESGFLYGISQGSGASLGLFKIALDLTGYTNLYNIGTDYWIDGSLINDKGFIFGAASKRDPETEGIIFKIKFDGTGFAIVKEFDITTGGIPEGMMLGSNHTLYLDNSLLGPEILGSIAKINTDGSNYQIIKKLYVENSGSYPGTHLTETSDGQLIGVGIFGGTNNNGVIFKINNEGDYNVIFNFNRNTDGFLPFDAPVPGPGGLYYGVTAQGGVNDGGIVYRIDDEGNNFQKIYDFDEATGAYPNSGLTVIDGRLYGITSDGGANHEGILFSMNADGSDFKNLVAFGGSNGQSSEFSNLVDGHDGFIYGCSETVVFKIRPNGTDFTKLYLEPGRTGFFSSPYITSSGDVLISSTRGGPTDRGSILKIKNDGTGYTLLHDFAVNLDNPNTVANGDLTLGPDGFIWGIEPNGGEGGTGIAFKIKPDGTQYTTYNLGFTAGPVKNMMPWFGLHYLEAAPDKLTQTVNFPEQQARTFGDPDFDLNATASSGLPVVYDGSDNVSIDGSTVTMLKPGRAYIFAWAEGNETYKRSEIVEQDFCINPPKPTITLSGVTLTSSNDDGNQWFFNSVKITNATAKTYESTLSGTYTVVTTIENCSSVVSEPQPVAIVTGLDKEKNPTITISPNPAANEIFVGIQSQSSVSLIDITGRVLGTYIVTEHSNRIEVGSLSKGVYILRIENNNSVTTKRFSKL